MRFQNLFTLATVFSTVALAADERKPSETVRKSLLEIRSSIRTLERTIAPPPIPNPGGGPPKPPNPDHAWLEERVKTQFPKLKEAYQKLQPVLADDAKNWDTSLEGVDPYPFCAAASNLFFEQATLVKVILKYYSGFGDEIKEIKAAILAFQKQCKALDDRLVRDLDPYDEDNYCKITHGNFRAARSRAKKLLKIGPTNVELR